VACRCCWGEQFPGKYATCLLRFVILKAFTPLGGRSITVMACLLDGKTKCLVGRGGDAKSCCALTSDGRKFCESGKMALFFMNVLAVPRSNNYLGAILLCVINFEGCSLQCFPQFNPNVNKVPTYKTL